MRMSRLLLVMMFSLQSSAILAISEEAAMDQANRLAQRLLGVPPSSSLLEAMKNDIMAGKTDLAAIRAIRGESLGFFKSTLVNMFNKYGTQELINDVELTDFTATIVGLAYNNMAFNRLMYDDVIYTGDDKLGEYYVFRNLGMTEFTQVSFDPADVSIATDSIMISGHGLRLGEKVRFFASGGSLPAPIVADTDHFIIPVDVNNFKVASNLNNAISGTARDITDAGTGTHALEYRQEFIKNNYTPSGGSELKTVRRLNFNQLGDYPRQYRNADASVIDPAANPKVEPLLRLQNATSGNGPYGDIRYDDNIHYRNLETRVSNWPERLQARTQSNVYSTVNYSSKVDNEDIMGVITSRQMGRANFAAGTNRRGFLNPMRFLCREINQLQDASAPDVRVRRDIDRAPGGDHSVFETNCRSCHAGMDGMAGAFAFFNFDVSSNEGILRYNKNGLDGQPTEQDFSAGTNQKKQWRQNNMFPAGHLIKNNTWFNFWSSGGPNVALGWRLPDGGQSLTEGTGAHALGEVLANAEAFSDCMANRAFERVCLRVPTPFESLLVKQMARDFESGFDDLSEFGANTEYNFVGLISKISAICFGNE